MRRSICVWDIFCMRHFISRPTWTTKVVRTLKPLILQPGLLTQAWLQGQRQPYAKPIQLFVVLNLVFFLLASVLGVQLIAVDANSVRLGMPGLSAAQLKAQRVRLGADSQLHPSGY